MNKIHNCVVCGDIKTVVLRKYEEGNKNWTMEKTCCANEYSALHNGETVHDVYCSNCGIKYRAESV